MSRSRDDSNEPVRRPAASEPAATLRQNGVGEAQARLAALVDSSGDAIISQDLDGVVRTWNRAAERMFGWAAAEVVGQPITVIVPRHLHGEVERVLARIRAGEPVEAFETVRIARDGHEIDVSVTMSPIHDAGGQVIGISKISRDITETKRIATALVESDRRKDQFLAMLAHELRNPLAALANAVELLALPDAASHLESTRRMMQRQTRQLVHLVDDLMDLSRISRGIVKLRIETLDVRTVVDRAIDTMRPSLESQRLLLVFRTSPEPLVARADPIRLEQLLVNLLGNAAKFTPPGGRVEVEVGRRNGRILLTVRDNGIGISRDLLPHVFDAFAQSEQAPDRSAGGLGIGLTLVKSIAAMHGGQVEARSEGPGRGSEFIVTLPAYHGDAPAEPAPSAPEDVRAQPGPARAAAACWWWTTTRTRR